MPLLFLAVIRTAVQDTAEFKLSLRTPAVDWLLRDNVDFPKSAKWLGLTANTWGKNPFQACRTGGGGM